MTEEKEIATETNDEEKQDNGGSDPIDVDNAIIQQIEYYFGDVNLIRDKFLREQVKLDDGWVPLDVLTRFNRLAKLSTDTDIIASALNKSESGLVEVSEDNKKVRRNPEMLVPEMNEERRKELQGRTAYAKGFPLDAVLDDLLKFFKEQGEVENIVMRRYQDKNTKKRMFKGSVFTTFKTKEEAEKFVQSKGLKYGDKELQILWQENYMAQKQEEYLQRKEKKNKVKEEKPKKEEKEFKLPTGTVLLLNQGCEKLTRENLRAALEPLGAEIAYIDFKQGDPEGHIRFAKENAAKEVAEKITDGKLTIEETEVTFKLLEGDEETNYLEETISQISKRRKNQKNFSRNNKGRNFKGKQQGRKRRQDQNDDGTPSKVKAES